MTPVDKTGATKGGTYVVCLECGKQFSYDWEQMRIKKPVDISDGATVASPDVPKMRYAAKSKLRFALLASAVPVAWAIGKAITSRSRRSQSDADSDRGPPEGDP